MGKAEERVREHLNKIDKVFTEEECKVIREGYLCIKPFVQEQDYSEVVSELETVVLTRKDNNDEISFDTVLKDTMLNLGIGREVFKVHLGELDEVDEAYDKTESTRVNAISRVYETLKCTPSLQNQVFLDVLSGIDRNVIARQYRLTRAKVDSIYTERLGFVKNILIVNDDILIEEVESRGPIQSNVKKLTDPNK